VVRASSWLIGLALVAGCDATEVEPGRDAAVIPRDTYLDAFYLPPVTPTVSGYCAAPIHCDDGDPCTVDACDPITTASFEGTCSHARIAGCVTPPDAGRPDGGVYDAGRSGPTNPVDPMCSSSATVTPVLVPYVPLGDPDVDLGCEQGIEWQNCSGSISLRANAAGGTRARTLVVDVATYTAPDRLRIQGIDASGAAYVLLDTCRIRTSEIGDPTDGRTRPPNELIRRFEITLREGTRAITLDATAAPSPWYMRVLGLCDLEVDVASVDCTSALRDCGSYRPRPSSSA
jgi:hypothetical protein